MPSLLQDLTILGRTSDKWNTEMGIRVKTQLGHTVGLVEHKYLKPTNKTQPDPNFGLFREHT